MIEQPQGPIPREIAKWLDSLDLAYQVRNMRRDISNGFIVAEILSRYLPKDVQIYTFDNGLNQNRKRDNWEQIAKILLKKKDYVLKPTEFEPILFQAPEAAQNFIFKLYELLKKKKLDLIYVDTKDAKSKPKQGQQQMPTQLLRSKPQALYPSYAKPTASILAKDLEIVRIVDNDERKMKTQNMIFQHDEKQRAEKQDENIIEYLILKRKRQIEEEIRKQEDELIKKQMRFNKKVVNLDASQQSQGATDIREIQLNCYHSSTSKKAKEQQGQLMETKGVIDFLHEACANLFKKDPIQKDIKDLKLEPKEAQQNSGYQASQQNVTYTNVIQQLFLKCDEVQKKSLKVLLNNFLDFNFQLIIESLNNNFIDFKRFFTIFLKPLEILKPTSKSYLLILELMRNIGAKLVELEPQGTQMMFENILLKDLLMISIKYPNKREQIIQVFFLFVPTISVSRLHLLHSIKQHIQTSLPQFMFTLAILIQIPYPSLDAELYNLFFYYAILALDSPSPLTRTNGLKVLGEVARWNYNPVLEKVDKVQRLMNDTWWEVRAQGLCICANLLLFLAEEEDQRVKDRQVQESTKTEKQQQEGQNQALGDEDDQALLEQIQSQHSRPQSSSIKEYKKQLLEIVYQIFTVDASQNVIRIGLIYLAPILTKYPDLCGRYLEILLTIESKIRETVLMTNPTPGMEIGQVVSGCNSFKYKLTGAPVVWYSVGIAQAIDSYVKQKSLQNFEYEHLEIILACLYNELQKEDGDVWFSIYENIKNLVFLALCEQELCGFASEILKKFFMFETIQEQVLKNSFKIFLKLLSLIYHPDIQNSCKENLLEFLEFLNERKVIDNQFKINQDKFQNYCYDIIKQFSEKFKDMFLRSNLVGFMNELAKEKRRELLGDEIY